MAGQTIRCVLYARFSPRPEKKDSAGNVIHCDSCKKQISDMHEWCRARGWQVVAEYHDDEVSGADRMQVADQSTAGQAEVRIRFRARPGLSQALDRLRPGYVLLVKYQDRLSRDPRIAHILLELIGVRGGQFASVEDGGLIDDNEEMGLLRDIRWAIAKWQRQKIRKTTKRRMIEYQEGGRCMTRRDKLPYGWKLDPDNAKKMVADQTEQQIITRIIALAGLGLSLRKIGKQLMTEGLSYRGKGWQPYTLDAIVRRHKLREARLEALRQQAADQL